MIYHLVFLGQMTMLRPVISRGWLWGLGAFLLFVAVGRESVIRGPTLNGHVVQECFKLGEHRGRVPLENRCYGRRVFSTL